MSGVEGVSAKTLERIQRFSLMDDPFMTVYFSGNIPCTELILRIILNKPDLVVKSVQAQKVLKNPQGRSVILDVAATDSAGLEYDIEVQRDDRGASPRRARYHSSSLDAHFSGVGKYFEELPETCVIFITENDVLGLGLPLYTIERTVQETGKIFGDGSHIVYVNASIQEETPLGRLMHDFRCPNPGEMFYDVLAKRAHYLKTDDEGVKIVSSVVEEIRTEGSVAKARGVAAAMHREGFPDDTIARITNEDVEVIRSWIREFEAGQ